MWMGMLNLFEDIGLAEPWPVVIYIAVMVISMGVLWLG
jgi:hypothetical protein